MNNVKTDTIIRTIVLVVALINQILTALGYNPLPFEDSEVTELVSTLITVVASLWAWWKNNSFTQNAIKADNYMENLKKEE